MCSSDLQHCLVNKMCPNYFIPQCNMLEHLSEETVMLHARKLSSVRSDPAEHLRTAIEHVKAATRLTLELQRRGSHFANKVTVKAMVFPVVI